MTLKAIVNKRGGKAITPAGSTVLTPGNSGNSYNNTGATALVIFTAPLIAKAGIEYEFIVTDADGIKFQANAADVIQDASQVTGTGGSLACNQIGGVLKVKSIKTGTTTFAWYVTYERRTWTLA